jgi:hypothetical protein
MSRRRWIIALAVLISLLVAVEVVVRRWERPKATLQIINEGDGLLEDLVVSYGDSRMMLGSLRKGESAHASITAGPRGPLRLEYRQKNNPIQSFWIDDYDPLQNLQDGYKQVLVLGGLQIQRYAEEDDTLEAQESIFSQFKRWLQAELNPFK